MYPVKEKKAIVIIDLYFGLVIVDKRQGCFVKEHQRCSGNESWISRGGVEERIVWMHGWKVDMQKDGNEWRTSEPLP